MSDCSYEVEETRFQQDFYNASLEDSIQWVNCVVLITTFLQHCTIQEHMVNGQ